MHDGCSGRAWLVAVVCGVASACADWPDFRGPFGNGHAAAPGAPPAGLPLRWSEAENVRWKTAVPHRGWSSPVVMQGRVWLTTATLDGREFFVLAYDALTGERRIEQRLFHVESPEPLGNAVNCYASPSPVLAPGRVFVHFGSYGTACLDAADGRVLWQRTDLPCRHYRGPGSSPVLFGDRLILTMDGVDVQYLVALDAQTGRTVWRTDRTADWNDLGPDGQPIREGDMRKAYSTPLLAGAAGAPRLFSAGARAVYAYDPRDGRELWAVRHAGYSAATRPVVDGDLAFMTTGYGQSALLAVRTGGSGDVTGSHVAWTYERRVAQTASPLVVDGLFYMVADDGWMACLEPATGAEVWRAHVGGNYAASPLYADGRIYLFNQQGSARVLRPGRRCDALATNALEAGCMASPAVDGRALIVRTKTHLYRLEAPP